MSIKHEYEIGKEYGTKILKELYRTEGRLQARVVCKFCGKESIVRPNSLYHEKYISCTCQTRKINGLSSTRIYHIYANMLYRCYTKTCSIYCNYGEKGIKVCEEWRGENGFINFYNWAMENGYQDDLTIDRINNNGDYCPENCQWLTKSANTARANKWNARRKPNSNKQYHGISPDGEEFIFDNANEFARQHGLSGEGIRYCANGKTKSHKGWKFYFE